MCTTHLRGVHTQASLVLWSKLQITEPRYEKTGCTWLSSRAMLFLETHTKVVDSLQVTFLSFTRAYSPIDHSAGTTLLTNPPTTSLFSCSHSSSQCKLYPVRFLTAFDHPASLTDCFPSSFNVSCSFPMYNPSTFPASNLFLQTNCFPFPFLPFGPFSFPIFPLQTLQPVSFEIPGPHLPIRC